ncbi:unnamed protein product [Rotaria sp. Silwood2]|nr:unnamed protein product [Rotaria sp. Silwood2]CAF4628613.1 unnamed protein product [Rotaria sp. Silwood2]
MHQVYHIYISGNKLFEYEQEWRKIKGVFTDISSISNTLRRNIHQYEQNTESISVIPTDINDNLNELDSSFMYSQLLKEMLLEIKYDQQAKAQFVKFCQDKYSHSVGILHAIDNFEQNYYLHSPIWWYTKEPFIYLVLNRALRLQNIDVILKMGFFIQDLHRQIEQLYSKKNQTADLTLYRGQGMSNTEFEKLKKNEGGLLAFNNFLSTSYDEEVSIAFATSAYRKEFLFLNLNSS